MKTTKSYVAIGINKMDETLSFYLKLGFTLKNQLQPNKDLEIAWIENNSGFIIELIKRKDLNAAENQRSSTTLCFHVDDLESVKKMLMETGILFNEFPLDDNKRAIRFSDPNGVAISCVG